MLRQAAFFLILVGAPLASASVYGQMSGKSNPDLKQYEADQVIEDMQPDPTFVGFGESNGRMKVQQNGIYYIYAQVFFESYSHPEGLSYNRVALVVKSGVRFSLMQVGQKRSSQGRPDYGNSFTGGIIQLNEGDEIYLKTVYRSHVWVRPQHTFFGAYKLN
ncbi:tumor necrosis factor ligand superfamily member 11-like [Montipora foliosa]|uniref:tumor necrosis factor ligand superfamily member 11-like n=1 Tax=Montipora foliosa TaxID=591990 RepID=UPI0035F11CF7